MNFGSLTDIDRMLEVYKAGERVRATRGIVDVISAKDVDAGAHGVVLDPKARGTRGLVLVDWGGFSFVTSAENLEPLGRAPNRGQS